MKIKNMPKIESPFIRKMIDKNYILTDEITEGYDWVFEDDSVLAIEKLHGTNVSIVIVEGTVTQIYNRTERIPFINKGKNWITEGLLNSKQRGYLEFLGDGQFFGELIGEKVNGNPYKLDGHLWIPFDTFAQKHLRYKSWGKYPKTYQTISKWFQDDLLPLYSSMQGNREGFVEGIVFTHPDGRMAKLRRDMFDWYTGYRHKRK
jgi:energy-coupling factor transporter ATP-binding protein EcfA2